MDPEYNLQDVRITHDRSMYDVRKYTEFSFCPIKDALMSPMVNLNISNVLSMEQNENNIRRIYEALQHVYNQEVVDTQLDHPALSPHEVASEVARLQSIAIAVLNQRMQEFNDFVALHNRKNVNAFSTYNLRQDMPSGINYQHRRQPYANMESKYIIL